MNPNFLSDPSLDDIRELVAESADMALLKKLDSFLGATLVVGAAATGQPGLLVLLGPKNELVKIGEKVVAKITGRNKETFLERHRRMTAAYHLVVYTAFFEAAEEVLSPLRQSLRLDRAGKEALAEKLASTEDNQSEDLAVGSESAEVHRAVQLPHPVEGFTVKRFQLQQFYADLTRGLERFVDNALPAMSKQLEERIAEELSNLPMNAVERQEAQYFSLAIEYPYFATWLSIHRSEVDAQRMQQFETAIQIGNENRDTADHRLDVGLAALGDAIDNLPALNRRQEAQRIVDGLSRAYHQVIQERIIDDRLGTEDGQSGLTYPRKADAFVPQAFKALRARPASMPALHLEDEDVWEEIAASDDLGDFVLSYLRSPYSIETPLIILGHPGSGKSLLTSILAARLATHFNPVRVVLRDVDVEQEIQKQVEDQICRDTGLRTEWGDFSTETADSPPVIILDGFDELLQASGKTHANYLETVEKFQRREAIQGRPVRVIVTSRITLIDKAIVPPNATVIRLLEFDESRQERWISIWNQHNEGFFADTGIKLFELPSHGAVRELASQPLLLLMLALFDSDANQLRKQFRLDRTLLYDNLLRRFIARERQKGDSGDVFRGLPKAGQDQEIDDDMRRLGVAAMSMFNRRTLHILSDELDRDIAFFDLEREAPDGYGRALTQAELLLGSFFFVHESKSRTPINTSPHEEGQTTSAFEFLHNTFGEFLTADFILSTVTREVQSLSLLSSEKALRGDYDRKLAGGLPDDWFVSLMYTPLYTRPVILEMIREWSNHLLAKDKGSSDGFINALDILVRTQLQRLLQGNDPPSLMTSDGKAPYDALPLLGHYAVYSLNLLLVRAVIGDGTFRFDESEIPSHEGGARAWDQLTHLWRSWLSIDNLSGLSAIVKSTRKGTVVEVRVTEQFGTRQTGGRLDTIWSTANTLADTVMASISGLHLYDASPVGPMSLELMREQAGQEQIDLYLEVSLRSMREGGWASVEDQFGELASHAANAVGLQRVTRSHGELLRMLMEDDAPVAVREGAREALHLPTPVALLDLPESFVDAHVRFCASLEPRWIDDLYEHTDRFLITELAGTRPRLLATILSIFGSHIFELSNHRQELTEWLTDLVATHDLHPEILISVVLCARKLESHSLLDLAGERLRRIPVRTVLRQASPNYLRALVRLSERDDAAMRGWLRKGRTTSLNLPADLAMDLSRLGLRVPGKVEPMDGTFRPWVVAGRPRESEAWLRLLAHRPANMTRSRKMSPWLYGRHVGEGRYRGLGIASVDLENLPLNSLSTLMQLADAFSDEDLSRFLNQLGDDGGMRS